MGQNTSSLTPDEKAWNELLATQQKELDAVNKTSFDTLKQLQIKQMIERNALRQKIKINILKNSIQQDTEQLKELEINKKTHNTSGIQTKPVPVTNNQTTITKTTKTKGTESFSTFNCEKNQIWNYAMNNLDYSLIQ
jgi:hypothetical protein